MTFLADGVLPFVGHRALEVLYILSRALKLPKVNTMLLRTQCHFLRILVEALSKNVEVFLDTLFCIVMYIQVLIYSIII